MKRSSTLAILTLYSLTVLTAQGEPSSEVTPKVDLKTLPRQFASDELRIWTSPFRSKYYHSHAIKKYVVPFVLVVGTLIATDHKTAEILPNTVDQTVWSGRVSQVGAPYTLAGLSGATFLIGQFAGNEHAKEAGLLSLEALASTEVVAFAFKQLTNRQRPPATNGREGFWEGGDSFPSGHAAGAFSVATVFAYEYREHLAVPIVAYSLAGVVSASRLSAQRHWVSDIAAGATLGFLIGRFTYKRNHNPELPGSPVARSTRAIPNVGIAGSSVLLSWHF